MLLTGLVGRPVSHSIGQMLYNRFYASTGIESMYISMDVAHENLSRFVEFSREHFAGYNVTIPHKVSIIGFLDKVDDDASRIGAVNLVSNKDGKSTGYNTDYLAMERLDMRSSLDFENSTVAIRGSGGVARTVLYYLSRKHPETEVTLISRNPESSGRNLPEYEFMKPLDIKSPVDITGNTGFDILINCSPVGMWPHTADSPFDKSMVRGCRAGIDLVYNPLETSFTRMLKESGKIAVDGFGFFVDQGYESLKIFFGREVNEKLFRKTAENIMKENEGNGWNTD